jgi:multiple sugar transport system permease protein
MLNNPRLYPVTVGLASWSSQSSGGGGSTGQLLSSVVTGSLLSVIPLIAAFLLLQRYWQSGLSAGGVKD